MWIMITKKLPIHPSPSKLSIFFATAWPMPEYEKVQEIQSYDYDPEQDTRGYFRHGLLQAQGLNEMQLQERHSSVLAQLNTASSAEVMREYVLRRRRAELPSHTLVENNEASAMMLMIAKDTDLRTIYESALVDGCNHAMAERTSHNTILTLPQWFVNTKKNGLA